LIKDIEEQENIQINTLKEPETEEDVEPEIKEDVEPEIV